MPNLPVGKVADVDESRSLVDSDIRTTRIDRRRFLSQVSLRSTALLGAALGATALGAACGKSDKCDEDFASDRDSLTLFNNFQDFGKRKVDNCDSDG